MIFEPTARTSYVLPAESGSTGTLSVIGYRDYVNSHDAVGADGNLRNFRRLIRAFKNQNGSARCYLKTLIKGIFGNVSGKVDLITCVPGHKKTPKKRVDSLARICGSLAKTQNCRNGGSLLMRTTDVNSCHEDSRMRSFDRQFSSIKARKLRDPEGITKILIIDDIYTSGHTMAACFAHLRNKFPRARITGFVFGMTTSRPRDPWPQSPEFPPYPIENSTRNLLSEFRQADRLMVNAPIQSNFYLTRWKKIHKTTCQAIPADLRNNYEPIASLEEGFRRRGQACRKCLPEHYVRTNNGITPAD